jgi:hypothetical protein
VAVFAANAADLSHVPTIPAHRQTTLASDLTLLFGAHRGETAATLFLTSAHAAFRTGSAAFLGFSGAARLSSTARAASLHRSTFVFGFIFHSASAAPRGATAGGALPITTFLERLDCRHG